MITKADAAAIIAATDRRQKLRVTLMRLNDMKAQAGQVTISGYASGGQHISEGFAVVIGGEMARGLIRAGLQGEIAECERQLRRLGAEIPA